MHCRTSLTPMSRIATDSHWHSKKTARSVKLLFHINGGEQKALPAKLEPVLELLNEDGHQGPDRYIFRLPQVIKNPMHIFFGEPTPGLHTFNRHQLLPPVIFRGFDLGTNTVSPGHLGHPPFVWIGCDTGNMNASRSQVYEE